MIQRHLLADVARFRASPVVIRYSLPSFVLVFFLGGRVDRTRVTARLLGLNGDSNGGSVGYRSIFCDFVSRCSVFFDDIWIRFCSFLRLYIFGFLPFL